MGWDNRASWPAFGTWKSAPRPSKPFDRRQLPNGWQLKSPDETTDPADDCCGKRAWIERTISKLTEKLEEIELRLSEL